MLRARWGSAGEGDDLPAMVTKLGRRVRLVLGDHLLVGKWPQAARQLGIDPD
jgi:hypothetical protein